MMQGKDVSAQGLKYWKSTVQTDRKHVITVIKTLPFFEGKSKKLEGKNIPCPQIGR